MLFHSFQLCSTINSNFSSIYFSCWLLWLNFSHLFRLVLDFAFLKIGFFITYIGPLVLVLVLTMLKEAFDDWQRYQRDKEANSAKYRLICWFELKKRILRGSNLETVPSSKLKVGDIIEVNANQRIPADLILLYTSEPSGSVFIRTDQLDGETDWKLR